MKNSNKDIEKKGNILFKKILSGLSAENKAQQIKIKKVKIV